MQILNLIAMQKGCVKLWRAVRGLFIWHHAKNLHVNLFLHLETFFFSSPRKLTAISVRGFRNRGNRHIKTWNKKVLNKYKKDLLANFAFNSFTKVLEIIKIMNFKLWRAVREPFVK